MGSDRIGEGTLSAPGSKKTFDQVPPRFTDRPFRDWSTSRSKDGRHHLSITRSGTCWKTEAPSERRREIVCSRVVFVDCEFDAKKGQGERPGSPVCICAIEIDQDGREIEHRLAAPYPAQPPWDRGDPFLTVGFALSAEAGSFCMWAGRSRCRRSTSMPSTW